MRSAALVFLLAHLPVVVPQTCKGNEEDTCRSLAFCTWQEGCKVWCPSVTEQNCATAGEESCMWVDGKCTDHCSVLSAAQCEASNFCLYDGVRCLHPTTVPLTQSPPTAVPETAQPTTVPVTVSPTTAPETQLPTTAQPTTVPDTQLPTTSLPTTVPDTVSPTVVPDTQPPTTAQPTTVPDTPIPTAPLPDTQPPTGLPQTLLPATQPPRTPVPPPALPTQEPETASPVSGSHSLEGAEEEDVDNDVKLAVGRVLMFVSAGLLVVLVFTVMGCVLYRRKEVSKLPLQGLNSLKKAGHAADTSVEDFYAGDYRTMDHVP